MDSIASVSYARKVNGRVTGSKRIRPHGFEICPMEKSFIPEADTLNITWGSAAVMLGRIKNISSTECKLT